MTALLQETQLIGKYARWREEWNRRENGIHEIADRVIDYFHWVGGDKLSSDEYQRLHNAITTMQAFPAMRVMQMAGPAARRDPATTFNCSYLVPIDLFAFSEALYLLMAGTGVGFSVEQQYISQLPPVRHQKERSSPLLPRYTIPDTAEGWADALKFGLEAWFSGDDIGFDYSQIRPAGAKLKTKGGRASGPEPLHQMLRAVRKIVLSAQGRQLSSVEVFDIMTYIGQCVVSGGVRRSAMAAIFDATDELMLSAKHPDNFSYEGAGKNTNRANANISVVWNHPPNDDDIDLMWDRLTANGTGEPGFYNRAKVKRIAGPFVGPFPGEWFLLVGPNPCFEIDLFPFQFCNLSSAIARVHDTMEVLREKIKLAVMFGKLQTIRTDFPYIRPLWGENVAEERLLGVDISGILDCKLLQHGTWALEMLKEIAIAEDIRLSSVFDIPRAASITCIKPSGNSGLVHMASSGLHPWWAPYYIRRIQLSEHDPIARFLVDRGVPWEPAAGRPGTVVLEFPMKAPEGAITRHDLTAVQACENWRRVSTAYTTHNASNTIAYEPHEVDDIRAWLKEHKEVLGGMSFYPASGWHPQMPMQEISQEEYEQRMWSLPSVDWSELTQYETDDETIIASEPACAGGACEIA